MFFKLYPDHCLSKGFAAGFGFHQMMGLWRLNAKLKVTWASKLGGPRDFIESRAHRVSCEFLYKT